LKQREGKEGGREGGRERRTYRGDGSNGLAGGKGGAVAKREDVGVAHVLAGVLVHFHVALREGGREGDREAGGR